MITKKEEYLIKRRRKKITHVELANYLHCSQSLISRYETGKCGMSKTKIDKYRKYIEIKKSKKFNQKIGGEDVKDSS